MPEIQVRPLLPADLPEIIAIDHNYITDYVWQMDLREKTGQFDLVFREVRLPRSVQVSYPRDPAMLADTWNMHTQILVADLGQTVVGYLSLLQEPFSHQTRIIDLAVGRRMRRAGIGTALMLAAQEWTAEHGGLQLTLEVQSKNFPAISLAGKLGFDFCGYNDRYYQNKDIALFFAKFIH